MLANAIQHGIKYLGPTTGNKAPDNILSIMSLHSFKKNYMECFNVTPEAHWRHYPWLS